MRYQRGVTLIELMVSVLIAGLIGMGVFTVVTNVTTENTHQTGQATANFDAQQVYHILTDLIRMAEVCTTCGKSVDITYPSGVTNPNPNKTQSQTNDSIRMDLTVPAGYDVWPNVVSPFTNNAVRFEWSNATGRVTIANASSKAGLATATPTDLVSLSANASRITNIDIWPLDASGNKFASSSTKPLSGYLVCVVARPAKKDSKYKNPEDSGALINYRTAQVCGNIINRN